MIPFSIAKETSSGQLVQLQVDSVMLVWRLGQSSLRRFTFNSFSVSDNWWGDLQWNTRRGVPNLANKISKCNSPVPATICSPDSEIGQDNGDRLTNLSSNPSTNFGKSLAFLTSTAICTTRRDREIS
ncbi:CBM_HP2_G0009910.mRNA.1.CDS.1 [Saccharomyces cerevisiae]|nr:CBM_HP2_G0009910.mRNA.1.CDS.1 [Saccharomyces cerevisiae]CAI6420737.1 CBM_HP2_G0009910.mRNA.1.CDS.1 [Saccharomyces cerevisiae]